MPPAGSSGSVWDQTCTVTPWSRRSVVILSNSGVPAISVPWPFGSLSPIELSRIEVPGTTFALRSACEPSTPVSSTATVAEAAGSTLP